MASWLVSDQSDPDSKAILGTNFLRLDSLKAPFDRELCAEVLLGVPLNET